MLSQDCHGLFFALLGLVALLTWIAVPGSGPAAEGQISAKVARTVVLVATADAYLRDGSANQSQGQESLLRIRSSGHNRALVDVSRADLTEVLAGSTLVSARLELRIQDNGGNWGEGRTVDVHRLTTAWAEPSVTWNCPADANLGNQQADCAIPWSGGAFDPIPTDSVLHVNELGGWVSWDVTPDVEAFLAEQPFAGWLLKKTSEGASGLVDYSSREVCGEEPRLVLELEAPGPDLAPPGWRSPRRPSVF
ncbi:MAG: DNRLRE domain-containing protein [Thermoanaerobaculia bacterium]|nr:DNRLRE domain-containing protein [Thermoanaerobaculia bacterium]